MMGTNFVTVPVAMLGIVPPIDHPDIGMLWLTREEVQVFSGRSVRMQPRGHPPESRP